jgi:arginyl-tRNA synthetase
MIRDALESALRDAFGELDVELPASISLERPGRREHGDWSTNAALVTGKKAGWKPRELADKVAERLSNDPPRHVTGVTVAGPGFVNFHLAAGWLHDVLGEVVTQGTESYARLDIGQGQKVNVEFVSPNPTGPVHAGHGRGAAYGDSLARLFERTGHDVHRECYLNDRGVQMQHYAASLTARKNGTPVPEDGYQGEYIAEWAAEMPDDADPLQWGEQRAIADAREVLDRLNVRFDTWFSERTLVDSGAMDATLQDLKDRDVVFEEGGATWLRSTDYGDDKDRVLIKSDGEPTYLLPDIAYHRDKVARGAEKMIDVWGADHHGYVPRMRAAIQSLGYEPDIFEAPIVQLVKLERGGEKIRLSKRTGELVELREVIDEVGPDAARLTFLLQSVDTSQTFDLEVVASQAMENPVFYVQMAHARIAGIARVAGEHGVERLPFDQVDLTLLTHERELEVLRKLSELPETLAVALADRAPHRVTTWVRELADRFHSFYHDCYVIHPDVSADLAQARLWLVESARVGLAIGLDLLGVAAPESM